MTRYRRQTFPSVSARTTICFFSFLFVLSPCPTPKSLQSFSLGYINISPFFFLLARGLWPVEVAERVIVVDVVAAEGLNVA